MGDRFTSGVIGGLTAGTIKLFWSLISRYALGLAQRSSAEYGALLTFNRPAENLEVIHHVWGALVMLGYSAGVGIIFVYLIQYINSERLYLKAIVYSWAAWFFFHEILVLRLTDVQLYVSIGTAVSSSAGATIFAAVLVFVHSSLRRRERV